MPTTGAATVDAPALNDKGTALKLDALSVKDVSQAFQICKQLEQNNLQRALRTAEIQAIHDGQPPRSPGAQAEKAKSWQSNASTGWLSGIVGRQAQRFVNAIISQPYLTYSRLPESYENAKSKSDLMQAKFTRLVRSWHGYTSLVNALSVETVLQGYTYGVFLDPKTAWPKMFKQDRLFLPEMAQMHGSELQFFCCKEDYRLDKFLDLISDKQVAEDMGYDFDNCIVSANEATMQDPREDATTTQFRKWEDMINEGTLGLSYSNTGERVVKVWLLFNREYDGQVSFWMIDRTKGTKLRFSPKIFKSMENVIVMFSFEPGNGCIHSSKGLGRKLAALSIIKEIFRNGIIDNARVSGLMIVQTDAKDRNKMAPQIMSPFIYLDKNSAIPQTQFQPNAGGYEKVDELTDSWAEQAVGAFLAAQTQDRTPDKTATQVSIEARREQEAADIQIRRWLDQEFTLVQVQQGRAFSDDYVDEADRLNDDINRDPEKAEDPETYKVDGMDADILRTLVEILRDPLDISTTEIKVWRDRPASVFAHVSDAIIQQGIEAVYRDFKGDPNLDQPTLIAKVVEGRVGAQDAEELIIPVPDQTVVVEAKRMQLSEATSMWMNLFKMDVSKRDNHIIHAQVCQQLLTALGPKLSTEVKPDPKFMQEVELLYNHMGDHLNAASQTQLVQLPEFAQLEKFFKEFGKQLKQVIQIQAQAKAATAAVIQKISKEGLPGEQPPVAPGVTPASPAPAAPAGPSLPGAEVLSAPADAGVPSGEPQTAAA
jgi:hypothetical protein